MRHNSLPIFYKALFFLTLISFLNLSAQNNSTPLDSALIACYNFSGNANDGSGNANHGTVNGAVLVNDRFGNPASAYSFSGSNQNIVIPGFSTQMPSNEFSISFWATATVSPTRSAFLMSPDDPFNRLNIHIYYTNQTFWDFGSIYSNGRLYIPNATLPAPNTWDHWVFVVSATNGGFMKCYKNGVLYGSKVLSSNYSNVQLKNLMIGGGSGVNDSYLWFQGKLDDIKIFKRVLIQNDVTSLFVNPFVCFQCAAMATPTVNNTNAPVMCAGDVSTLTALSTGTVNWFSASAPNLSLGTGTAFVTPTLSPGTYTYFAVANNSCQSTATSGSLVLTVNPNPSLSIASGTSICQGQNAVLNAAATGTGTILWYASPALVTAVGAGTSFPVPNATPGNFVYYAMLNALCSSIQPALANVTVNALPVLNVTAKNGVICRGESLTLNANGAQTYTWSTGAIIPSIMVNPTVSVIYTVTGTDANNCSNSTSFSISVVPCESILEFSSQAEAIDVYPNPSAGDFNLRINKITANTQLKIYNAEGKLVNDLPLTVGKSNYKFENFAKGVYFIQVLESSQVLVQKKIIVK